MKVSLPGVKREELLDANVELLAAEGDGPPVGVDARGLRVEQLLREILERRGAAPDPRLPLLGAPGDVPRVAGGHELHDRLIPHSDDSLEALQHRAPPGGVHLWRRPEAAGHGGGLQEAPRLVHLDGLVGHGAAARRGVGEDDLIGFHPPRLGSTAVDARHDRLRRLHLPHHAVVRGGDPPRPQAVAVSEELPDHVAGDGKPPSSAPLVRRVPVGDGQGRIRLVLWLWLSCAPDAVPHEVNVAATLTASLVQLALGCRLLCTTPLNLHGVLPMTPMPTVRQPGGQERRPHHQTRRCTTAAATDPRRHSWAETP
mmetsp:Transcript_102769/g.271558  ORF Transcript_102769/g.271558 Transcript_102769/m.271558 type:complete len:313 (+) Transcript_102769:835-1773(+)